MTEIKNGKFNIAKLPTSVKLSHEQRKLLKQIKSVPKVNYVVFVYVMS